MGIAEVDVWYKDLFGAPIYSGMPSSWIWFSGYPKELLQEDTNL
jgi:hypothetical protein